MTTKIETKRTPAIAVTINNDALHLVFANGEELRINASELSNEIRDMAIMHGLKQKLVDAAAISRNPDTGRSASIHDKFEAVRAVFNRLLAGQWNATRGEGTGSGGLLFRALCKMYEGKRDADWIREYLDGKSKAEQAALRANPKVAAVIEELRTSNVDTEASDSLLDELEADDE